MKTELDEANKDLAWWEAIFKPIGYRIHGWTYRNHASVISPTDKYVSADSKIIELVRAARSHPDSDVVEARMLQACLDIAEDVKLKAETAAAHMSYGELYGEQCKIEAADEIIERVRAALSRLKEK